MLIQLFDFVPRVMRRDCETNLNAAFIIHFFVTKVFRKFFFNELLLSVTLVIGYNFLKVTACNLCISVCQSYFFILSSLLSHPSPSLHTHTYIHTYKVVIKQSCDMYELTDSVYTNKGC